MAVKFLFHSSRFEGWGYAKFFDDYASLKNFLTDYLLKATQKQLEKREWRRDWGHDGAPSKVGSILKGLIPAEHKKKRNYSTGEHIEYRYCEAEPKIWIGEERPLVIPNPQAAGKSFPSDYYEIHYGASLPIEVRLVYTTTEGEVKVEGLPYVPAHKEEHVTPGYTVYQVGKGWERKLSLEPGENHQLFYTTIANGSVNIVKDEE